MSLRTLLLVLLGCGIGAWGGWAALASPKAHIEFRELALVVAVSAEEIESLQFQVFDLSGRRIFNSGTLLGVAYYKWYFHRNDQQFISNGVYLYLLTTRVGKATYTIVGKLVVRR
ncbi:MAG: hypothetical protein NZO41_05215 [Candidatus Bipolaricaulota bacterium]|nr:hypothetical protein [Candidatus Bipolaricaulota bacterium]